LYLSKIADFSAFENVSRMRFGQINNDTLDSSGIKPTARGIPGKMELTLKKRNQDQTT